MELCFLGAADYRAAFAGEPDRPGPILDPDGREIGRHRGIRHYTVGQRRGLGQSFGPEPVYVLAIRPERNALVVGPRAAGRRRRVRATALRALQPERLEPGARLRGMVRSRSDLEACTLLAAGDEELAVDFDEPRFAVAPGQRLVLYDRDDCVVAGGEIMPSPA
jgi:tRNA-specific 2-thiouridylase